MSEIKQYQTFVVKKDGTKQYIEGKSIIIQVGGEEIEISLVPAHPVFEGKLTLAAGSAIEGRQEETDSATRLVIEPGASNVLHITPQKM